MLIGLLDVVREGAYVVVCSIWQHSSLCAAEHRKYFFLSLSERLFLVRLLSNVAHDPSF